MIAYPSSIPVPSSNFNASFQTGLSRTKFASGRSATIGASGKTLFSSDLTFVFLPNEREIFADWWENDIGFGEDPFELTIDTGAGNQIHIVQALAVYREVVSHDYRTISLPVKILNRPTNVSDAWADTYNTLPAQWPSEWLPDANSDANSEDLQMFEATSGVSTAKAFLAPRGKSLKLTFTFSLEELNYFLKWFEYCAMYGRKAFVADFPIIGQKLFRFVSDPTLVLSGMFYTLSVELQASYFNGKYSVTSGWGVNWGEAWGGEA